MRPIANYIQDFLRPAHPTRMATEPRAMPRARTADGDAEIWPTATNEDIARGYRIAPNVLSPAREPRRYALRRLDKNNYSWVRHHLFHKRGGKHKALWLFTTYQDEALVNWMQFDLDRHYEEGATPDEKAEVDHYFHQQVRILQDIADDQGFDIVWTTSPGDLDPFDGQHIQGLYAWIKLDRHTRVADLRRFVEAFKARNWLEIECCWDTRHRNIRLGGQEFVEVADPDTITIINPVKKQQREALGHFATAWATARPANATNLFDECVAWYEAQQRGTTAAPSEPAVSETQPGRTVSESPGLPGRVLRRQTQRAGIHVPAALPTRAALLGEHNTFKAATHARICSLLARKYRGDRASFEIAVQEGMAELRAIRPASSKTCGSPTRLRSTVTRWLNWYFKGFRQERCVSQARITDRDIEDRKRVAYCLGLDRARVLRHLKPRNLTYHEKSILSKFLDLADKWNYRVAVKAIYDSPKAICTKFEWFTLVRKLKGILFVVTQAQVEERKCRQWAITQSFVQQMEETEKFIADVLQRAEGGEEKKKKLVYGSHNSSAAHGDLIGATCCFNDPPEPRWTTLDSEFHDFCSISTHPQCAHMEISS